MVSKKYLGHVTPKELQNEILNFLNFCSIQYPNYKHFEESYNLLKNEDFQMIPAPQVEPRPNFFPDKADEIKFKKLLKSTNKEDVKKANLYLKHFYEKEQQKAELKMRTTEELREYEETVKLLNDMLASNTHEFAYGKVVVASQSETPFDLIKELYERCVKYQTILKQMPTIIDCSDGALMDSIFHVAGDIDIVITRYQSATKNHVTNEVDLKNDELICGLAEALKTNKTNSNTNNSLNELQEVFSNLSVNEEKCSSNDVDNLLLSTDVLLPLPVLTTHDPDNEKNVVPRFESQRRSRLSDLDKLSEDLLKQQLDAINEKKTFKATQLTSEKPSLNDLKDRETISLPCADTKSSLLEDINNCLLDIEGVIPQKLSLADITLNLDDIIPSNDTERILLDEENGLKVTMNFTQNKPCKNISVIVISITNKSKLPVAKIQLDASVKKPSKVRVMEASDNNLPGFKPFRPVESINQIILLHNPIGNLVDLMCIISYKLSDDPDMIKECLIAKDVPFTE
ncbi:GGA1 family protein [Megaselia abdita]